MMKIVTQKMLAAQGLRANPPVVGDSNQGVHQLWSASARIKQPTT